jgi:uncharacterized zinc-type alcohol dehydrogenase-like protein
MCAGITLYSPLVYWKAGPGKKVAIIGFGGLGHMGVKIAHALGAQVTVLSHSLENKKMPRGWEFYATSDPKTFEILKGHFDLIVNTVSIETDLNQYLSLLGLDGTMVIVGLPEKEMSIGAFSLIMHVAALQALLSAEFWETQEMLDFCNKHNILCDIELIAIQKVNEAYQRVINSDVRYRFVIDTKSLKQK